tara:strand:+ start:9685 stop:9906 length:222 start_codon:yes stop_codon:yes gene_type:complete
MKIIENLDVRVTYSVGLGDIEVPDEIYDELMEIVNNGIEVDENCEYYEAAEWLRDNIREGDCYERNAEIIDIY